MAENWVPTAHLRCRQTTEKTSVLEQKFELAVPGEIIGSGQTEWRPIPMVKLGDQK